MDLIARLEAATGPDRELDALIFADSGQVNEYHCNQWCRQDGRTDLTRERYIAAWAPAYTGSIDAALTLVPEGCKWSVGTWSENFATVGKNSDNLSDIGVENMPTPAIALCIAALKARHEGRMNP